MFVEAHQKYGDKVQFVSISKDDPKHSSGLSDTRDYVAKEGLSWIFGEGQHVVDAYSVTKIPTTVFIDREGFLVFNQEGFMELADMELQLQRMLGEVVPQDPTQ